jgi:uncharacterized protein YaeQ
MHRTVHTGVQAARWRLRDRLAAGSQIRIAYSALAEARRGWRRISVCLIDEREHAKLALNATIYTLDIGLADADRQVFEALALRVARHPSETEEHLWARVLAYCLEYVDGIAIGRGLSDPDAPAIAVRDLTGALRAWIDVGLPDAARLHKAAKAAPRVAVYTHRDPGQLVRALGGERIHRAAALEIYAFDRALIAELVARTQRRMAIDLSVTGGHLYLSLGGHTMSGEVRRVELPAG